jgi:hypothetical protein
MSEYEEQLEDIITQLQAELDKLRDVRAWVKRAAQIDFDNGDMLDLNFGGDGDNGEFLIDALEAALTPLSENAK